MPSQQQEEQEEIFDSEYVTGSKTIGTRQEPIQPESPAPEGIESARYGIGKPTRIMIRARITSDQG